MAGFVFSRVFSADNGEMVQALLEDCRTETPSPRLQQSLESPSQRLSPQEFAQVINLWDNYRGTMLGFFDDFDILISPVNAHTALKQDEMEDLAAYTYTSAYNLTGWPGVVIRAGQDQSGLPIGVQILAAPFREDRCLAVAKWLEEKLPDFKPPATTSA
jgi:amidase